MYLLNKIFDRQFHRETSHCLNQNDIDNQDQTMVMYN